MQHDAPQNMRLLAAIRRCEPAAVREALAEGASVADRVEDSYPLWEAIRVGNIDTIDALLAAGADPGRSSVSCQLQLALDPPQPAVLRRLLAAGANPNAVRDGRVPLHIAVVAGESECVQALLEHGASASVKSTTGDTPLDIAHRASDASLVELLVKYGGTTATESSILVPLSHRNMERAAQKMRAALSEEHSPEERAASTDALLQLLGGARPEDEGRQSTLLLRAILGGADLSACVDGASAVSLAIRGRLETALELLLLAGADPNRPRESPPLCHAVEVGFAPGALALMRRRADVRQKDQRGWTALHHAVDTGAYELVEKMIEQGADVASLPEMRLPSNDDGASVLDLLGWHRGEHERTAPPIDSVAKPPRRSPRVHPTAPTILTRDGLMRACRQRGLSRLVERLVELARDAVLLFPSDVLPDGTLPLGVTKFGGSPDLPVGTPWPRHGFHGAPLTFLAQINLADVAPFHGGTTLPARGLLSFFYRVDQYASGYETNPAAPFPAAPDDPDLPHAARVLFIEEPADLHRHVCPRPRPPTQVLPARLVAFRSSLSLPDPEGLGDVVGGVEDAEFQAYIEMVKELIPADTPDYGTNRLLGYADCAQQGPVSSRSDSLLLQLGTSGNFQWGDLGYLYFQMQDERGGRDFDSLYIETECT